MINKYLTTAIQAVESSGNILKEYFEKLHDFRQKNQNIRDLVTEVDILSEKNIKRRIVENHPNHNIIGEETGELGKRSKHCWHVDPIDGTVNYSQGIPMCAVSVGLEENGEIIVGAVYNPFTEELFFASQGKGAFRNGQQIEVSDKSRFEDGLYVAAFSSDAGKVKGNEYEIYGKINGSTRGVLRIGSAALALAYLACGRIDGFWAKNLCSWDIAGGLPLVNEAGGRATNENGEVHSLKSKVLIASNSLIHEHLIKSLTDL
tara:strand:- start:592 stop:1374 length:783 start_codon:yes stop_codon:yes gene_type:complete